MVVTNSTNLAEKARSLKNLSYGKKNKFIKGLCHGVFDLVHIGHLRHFTEAKKYCDHLVVSITSDRFVRKAKGPKKPTFNQDERFKILSKPNCLAILTVIRFLEYSMPFLNVEGP